MKIEFIQNMIDSVSGRSAAIRDRRAQEHQLANRCETFKQEQLVILEREIEKKSKVHKEVCSAARKVIEKLEQQKRTVIKAASAIIDCVFNKPESLINIVNSSQDMKCRFELINAHPIHIVVALYKLKNVNVLNSIKQLMQCEALDYRGEYYGVSPIDAMIKDPVLGSIIKERMLKDIIKAIDQHNFGLAIYLIEYDVEHFKNVRLPQIQYRDLLCYAVHTAGQAYNPEQVCKFIEKLITQYGFSPVDSKYKYLGAEHYYENVLANINSPVSIPKNKFTLFGSVGFNDYTLKRSEPIFYENCEVYKKIYDSLKFKGELGNAEIGSFFISNNGKNLFIRGGVSIELARVISNDIAPNFISISFNCCTFNTSAAVILVKELTQASKVESITFNACNIKDSDCIGMASTVVENVTKLKRLNFISDGSLTMEAIEISTHLMTLPQYKALQRCQLHFSMMAAKIKTVTIVKLYEYMQQLDCLENIELNNLNIDGEVFIKLLEILLKPSPNNLKKINLKGISIQGYAAEMLKHIINISPKLSEFVLESCNLDSQARTIISSWNLQKDPRFEMVRIVNCEIPDMIYHKDLYKKTYLEIQERFNKETLQLFPIYFNQPELSLPVWQSTRKSLITKAVSSIPENKTTERSSNNLYNLHLMPSEFELLKEALQQAKLDRETAKTPEPGQVLGCINKVRDTISSELSKLARNFFQDYAKEVKSGDLASWRGSVLELHIIAKLLRCRIHLHEESFNNNTKIYGSDAWDKDIHLIRRGYTYYGCSVEEECIIPNTPDELNLFRACVHAGLPSTSIDAFVSHTPFFEQCAQQLRIDTANCLQYSFLLCWLEYYKAVIKYKDANTKEDIFIAARDLPQSSLDVVKKIISLKNRLSALNCLINLTNFFNVSSGSELNRALELLEHLFNVQQVKQRFFDFTLYIGYSVSFEDLDFEEIKRSFETIVNDRVRKIEQALYASQKILADATDALAQIADQKDAAIKIIQDEVDRMLKEGRIQININYMNRRDNDYEYWCLMGGGFVISGFVGGLVSPFLQGFLTTTVGLSTTDAILASYAITQYAVQHVVTGGKLSDLPQGMILSFIGGKVAITFTNLAFGGLNIHNFSDPNNAGKIDKILARKVTVTHKTVAAATGAVLNNRNGLKKGAVTFITNAALSTALDVDHRNPVGEGTFLLDVGVTASSGVLEGLENDEIFRTTVMQALESQSFALGKHGAGDIQASLLERKLEENKETIVPKASTRVSRAKPAERDSEPTPPSDSSSNNETVLPPVLPKSSSSPQPTIPGPVVPPSQTPRDNSNSVKQPKSRSSSSASTRDTQSISPYKQIYSLSNSERKDVQTFDEYFEQQTDYWDRPNNSDNDIRMLSRILDTIDERVFTHVRSAKSFLIKDYFGAGARAYERAAMKSGRTPDYTKSIFAAPLLAEAGLSIVPSTSREAVIDVLIFSATKPVLFVGSQVLRQGKQAYLIGTMGVGRGRVAFALTEALNSTPILNSLPVGLSASGIRKQMVFSPTTNAREVVVSFSKSSKSLSSKRYAQGKLPIECASKKVPGQQINPNVARMTEVIEEYLGKDFSMIKNKSGDPVFINKDNTRVIRFDSKNPHGDIPHGHVQFYDKESKKWLDYTAQHRIYLRATPELLNKPKPGKE